MKNLRTGLLLVPLSLLVACGDQMVGWLAASPDTSDHTPPTVTSSNPGHDAVAVALNVPITATFSEPIDPLTLMGGTFSLAQGASPVGGTVLYSGLTVLFTPTDLLDPEEHYTATLTTAAEDLAGNAMVHEYVWNFTTGLDLDLTPPHVSMTNPVSDANGVDGNISVIAVFDEAMDPATVTDASFTLYEGLSPIDGLVLVNDSVATFDPTEELDPAVEYTATLTTDTTDLAGNPLSEDYIWSFTIAANPDASDPLVVLTVPDDGATEVPPDLNLTAVFSEAMDGTTVNTDAFTLQDADGVLIAGVVTPNGPIAVFNPALDLDFDAEYTATVTNDVTDLAGNAMANDYVWTFTTGTDADETSPLVIATVPEDGAIDVAFDTMLTAMFDEPMDELTLTADTFTLFDELGVQVIGVVVPNGTFADFNPNGDLEADMEYTATITTGAADLAGNSLLEDYVWTFVVSPLPDTTMPEVILTVPEDQQIDVPLDQTVSAVFNEFIDPLSIDDASFTLVDENLIEVLGVTGVNGAAATFNPDQDLDPNTEYTATLTTDVTDLDGNPLFEDYVWTFTTGETPIIWDLLPVDLGSLGTFVAVAGAGLTNSNSSGITTLNGDVGLYPTGTCLGDGSVCSLINPVINGTLYANDAGGVAMQAKTDLTAAYVDALGRPPGTTVNDISGMTLAPGVYTSNSTMSIAVGGTVILDGQGDPNSVWIFQVGSSLTVNNSAMVLLVNGASSKNVFWGVFASSTLGSNVRFQGNVFAGESNSVGTDSVVVGRLLCTTGAITLLSNNITLPPL